MMQNDKQSNNQANQTAEGQLYAQLQQCGVDVYEPLESLLVAELTWLEKVCDLLSIEKSACLFDAQQAYFDNENKQLHLPRLFYGAESDLKKAIWRNIQQWV